jgi:hypothetical protein
VEVRAYEGDERRRPEPIAQSLSGAYILFDRVLLPAALPTILEQLSRAQERWLSPILKPLGITGEIGEYEAACLLGLKLSAAREAGYDAIDPIGHRYQIKARCINENGLRKSQRLDSIERPRSCRPSPC